MGIPRGFLRLAILAGFVGLLAVSYKFATDPYHRWDGSPVTMGDYLADPESLSQRLGFTLFFIGVPVFLTLLAGWVVARFRSAREL